MDATFGQQNYKKVGKILWNINSRSALTLEFLSVAFGRWVVKDDVSLFINNSVLRFLLKYILIYKID